MSDDHERPGDRPGRGGPEPDETREFVPFDEPTRSGDTPRTGDDVPPSAPDPTQPLPRTPGVGTPSEGTLIMPAADDATSTLDDATVVQPADPGRAEAAARAAAGGNDPGPSGWSGRAEVRPPGTDGDPTRADWAATDWAEPTAREPRGAWWMPIVVGIVALVLLAALGTGIWLIVRASNDDDPVTPAVTPSAPPASLSVSTGPTSAAPTTTPPRTTAATTRPVEVAIPALVGLSSADARRALDRVGLTYRLIYRPDDAPPETVIDSDPPEGRQVPADTEVTLVIAAPVRTTVATVPPTSPVADAPDDDSAGDDRPGNDGSRDGDSGADGPGDD